MGQHRLAGGVGVAPGLCRPWCRGARSSVCLDSKALGNVYLGREYVPIFWPGLKLDPWMWDTVGSPSLNHQLAGYRIDGHARANNLVGCKSVKFGGFSVNLAVSAGEGVPPSSRGANVEYSDGPLNLAAAFDRQAANSPAPTTAPSSTSASSTISERAVCLACAMHLQRRMKPEGSRRCSSSAKSAGARRARWALQGHEVRVEAALLLRAGEGDGDGLAVCFHDRAGAITSHPHGVALVEAALRDGL